MKDKLVSSIILGAAALFYFGWVQSTSTPTIVQTEQVEASASPQIEASEFPHESLVSPSEIPVPAESPTPSPSPVKNTPTPKPSLKPSPTLKPSPSPKPSVNPSPKTTQKVTEGVSGGYGCDCSKTCTQISSCAEAQYLLNSCGCSARDGDKDGIACDGAPLNCD